MTDFEPLTINTGLLLDLSDNEYPCRVSGWKDGCISLTELAETHFGTVTDGTVELTCSAGIFAITAGMFFVCPGTIKLNADQGSGLVVSRLHYTGLFQIGGPVEQLGRLHYIDGCTDTLLASPAILGDPCLNHLHIPTNTSQTQHTHPSERIGVILKGRGECRTQSGVHPLVPGMGWRIPTGCVHSFYTTDSSLDVIAWHPDSDFGPTHENHPMKNKTIIGEF